jgi:hypothetical protein
VQIDLDLANVRAFVVAAHELHFGRAPGKLFLSQQGLSKRISRLEANLGVTLFVRTAGSVSLTDAGRRFWPHAERLVELANAAAAAAQPASASPLRVDVWGHVQQPLQLVREIFERNEAVQVEVGMAGARPRRSMRCSPARSTPRSPTSTTSTARSRPRSSAGARLRTRRRQRVRRPSPRGAARGLAARPRPAPDVVAEGRRSTRTATVATQFASEHGIVLDLHGRNLGAEHLVHVLADNPDRLSHYRADGPLPPDVPVRVIPIVEPVLLYPWRCCGCGPTPIPCCRSSSPRRPRCLSRASAPTAGDASSSIRSHFELTQRTQPPITIAAGWSP